MCISLWICFHVYILSAIVCCSAMNRPINWSEVTNNERQYAYPAFVEVATSQCDLTDAVCDVSCCSDADCTAEQKLSFDCLGGLTDGEKAEVLPSWNCQHQSMESDNFWVPLLCYVITNTPYLGEYFTTDRKIESIAKINTAVTANKKFSYRQLYSSNNSNAKYYKIGSPIKTKTFLQDNIYEVDYLKLPRSVINDRLCSDSVELKYLENVNTKCLRTLSKKHCQMGYLSAFSALNYMIYDTSTTSSAHFSLPRVTQDYLATNITQTKVKYLCYTNGSDYLTFSKSIFGRSDSPSSRTSSNQQIPSDCSLPSDKLLSTYYNHSSEMCQNVLVSAAYNFKWNSSNVTNLEATYAFVDIPVTPDALISSGKYAIKLNQLQRDRTNKTEFYVTQRFVVTFEHEQSRMVTASSRIQEEYLQQKVDRSGNPGYDLGLPLLVWNWNATNGTVGMLQKAKISVWQNGHRGCRDISHVAFGYDVTSSCTLELQAGEREDCDALRDRVSDLQESLVTGKFIARGGANPIARNTSFHDASLVPILLRDIPSVVYISNTSDVTSNTTDTDATATVGIPTSRITHILYTTAVDSSGRPVYRVVGAKTSFVRVPCPVRRGADDRPLLLTSSVVFVSVPLRDAAPRSRFWQQVAAPDESNTAWFNIFHVMDDVVTGDVVFQMGTACVALLVMAAVLSPLFKRRQR